MNGHFEGIAAVGEVELVAGGGFSLRDALEVRGELIDELVDGLGGVSSSTTTDDDRRIAEHLAERLIGAGWVIDRPEVEPVEGVDNDSELAAGGTRDYMAS